MRVFKIILKSIIFLMAIFAIFFAILYWKSNKEKKELTDAERKGTTGQYIKLSDGVTHYELAGPDTGKIIILIHGFSVPYYIWDNTFAYLEKQGFRVLRYDMFGRGYSDRPDVVYNQDFYQRQLLELIKGLKLKTPVSLAGVSFGGEVITNFTAKYPDMVAKVILVDPGYRESTPAKAQLFTNYYEVTHGDERAESQLADFKYPGNYPGWVAKYRQQMQYKGFRDALVSTLYNYKYKARPSLTALNAIKKPVLLIWGKDDQTVPFTYSDSVRSVLKVDFFPVDDSGHLPNMEQAGKVNAKIAAFLRQ